MRIFIFLDKRCHMAKLLRVRGKNGRAKPITRALFRNFEFFRRLDNNNQQAIVLRDCWGSFQVVKTNLNQSNDTDCTSLVDWRSKVVRKEGA